MRRPYQPAKQGYTVGAALKAALTRRVHPPAGRLIYPCAPPQKPPTEYTLETQGWFIIGDTFCKRIRSDVRMGCLKSAQKAMLDKCPLTPFVPPLPLP